MVEQTERWDFNAISEWVNDRNISTKEYFIRRSQVWFRKDEIITNLNQMLELTIKYNGKKSKEFQIINSFIDAFKERSDCPLAPEDRNLTRKRKSMVDNASGGSQHSKKVGLKAETNQDEESERALGDPSSVSAEDTHCGIKNSQHSCCLKVKKMKKMKL
jgi:hypothetical protein